MLPAFVCTLFVLRASAPGTPAPGIAGCAEADSSAPLGLRRAPEAGRDLDPASCSARCRDGGALCLRPSQEGVVVIYRSETPFLHNITVSAVQDDGRVCTLHLSALQPPPGSLVLSVHYDPLGVPSCPGTAEIAEESLSDDSDASETLASNKHLRLYFALNEASDQKRSLENCERSNVSHDHFLRFDLQSVNPSICHLHLHLHDCLPAAAVVRIYAAKQAYPTNAEIIFLAVADVPDPVELVWHFGDSTSAKTNSWTISKRYHSPGSYSVYVVASVRRRTVTSEAFPLVVQRAVKLNRLVHRASVLQNQTVTVVCRVNAGTDPAFTWNFGDGTTKPGQEVEEHVFYRTGEFRVQVTASNRVSSASLSSHIFVVDRHCQPPPVKNMGPNKVQARRYEAVRLGVTYEADVDCDASEGVHYTWTLLDSAGRTFPLPLTDTHSQSLVLQSRLLPYDTYTAIAKVQVIGSVVYSNYNVRVQVMPSRPVALIRGGTNVFISRESSDVVTLDGAASYDPDFPTNPLSYSWTCKPVSSISSSCFDQHVPNASPVLKFPTSGLKRNFDQFQFTLTVHSGECSASSDTFITVMPNLAGRVFIQCTGCQGERVNWDQPFSVFASCEDRHALENHIQYAWSLHRVNASSKPDFQLPFCYTADLSPPSSVLENPVTHSVKASENEPEQQIMDPSKNWTSLEKSRNTSDKAGLLLSELSSHPLHLDNNSDLYLDHFAQRDVTGEFPAEPGSSADGEFYFPLLESGAASGGRDPDYEVFFTNAAEGEARMSAGRPTGEGFGGGVDSIFDPPPHQEEEGGSNLVDLTSSVAIREPTLLDLTRDSISRGLFESYTYTGVSSSLVRFRPFSLRPGSRYMVEVAAKSENGVLGRAQLFLKTNPAPKGMTCQVQPDKGMELHTHFSIFCMSGREDLLYKYSYSVRDEPPRTLYQGRDFHYYFSLPSGDLSDGFKVTVHTEVRSSTSGSAARSCPVTVQVQPSFLRDVPSPSSSYDPDLELSDSGLRNLTALLQLGNNMETRNYISLLSGILNRLSRDAEANAGAQTRLRTQLILTLCDLKSSTEASVSDTVCILKELLQFASQVTSVSARRVAAYVQDISERFSESRASEGRRDDQKTLSSLVGLLSLSLQGVTTCQFTPGTPSSAETTQPPETNPSTARRCSKQGMHLVPSILQTASDLMLELTVSTDLFTLYAAASQNQTSTVIRCASATFSMPASLIQVLLARHGGETERQEACVVTVVTELARSPYTWATDHTQVHGPVVELNLYTCSVRKKIPVRFLIQPISIVLQRPPRNRSSVLEFILSQTQVNYHSFNITQKHLQHSIQLTVTFTPLINHKAFPVLLLFSMFEKPTPSRHHFHKIHHWRSNMTRITLPSSYLSAAGVGHLALLPADFGKTPRRKHLSEQMSYSVSADSSVCLSWESQQRAWTRRGCSTRQTDAAPAVNCSCHQLRPLTVLRQELQSSCETSGLDQFISASSDLTLLGVLLLSVFLFVPGLVACRRADDATSEASQRVHYLSDNSPSDQHLYAVTVHTGLRSAARMSAKVYIVLCGENKSSHTKELQVPQCNLFRRNSRDTFILSAADRLGGQWGVHIWHDNSGSSPDWFLKHIEVSEVTRGHVAGRSWLFVAECWLSVNKGDGRVERMLRVCSGGLSFSQLLRLKLSDYLSDFHIWTSVYSCPRPDSFTHTQRLGVCLLLLLGYACANAAFISLMDEQSVFELGLSSVSVKTGLLSVVAVLPVATLMSFLFRLCGTEPARSGAQHEKDVALNDSVFEPHLSRSLISKENEADEENHHSDWTINGAVGKQEGPRYKYCPGSGRRVKAWCCCLVWALSLSLCLCCLLLSALLGMSFSSSDVLLWIHSLFVSLMSCIFLMQPAAIFIAAVAVSCCHRKRPDVYSFSSQSVLGLDVLRSWSREADHTDRRLRPSASSLRTSSCLEKQLEARRRARFLRHVRPPAPAELRKSRRTRRREALMQKTLRDVCLCASMLLLMGFMTYGCSLRGHYQLNAAIRKQIIRSQYNGFMSVQKWEDLWRWTQTRLLDLLYQDHSLQTETYILIGDPILEKTERSDTFHSLVSTATPSRTCGLLGCVSGPGVTDGLGYTKSEAASKLQLLRSRGWLDGQRTVALKVRFTLYSPAPGLFSSVTLLAERSPAGVLLPAAKVQSVRVFHTGSVWDCVVMLCQLVFLFLSLLQLCHQVSAAGQQGLMGYWRTPSNWAEVSLLTVTLLYYVYSVYRSTLIVELVDLLQRRNHRGSVDVSQLANCEQFIRTLRGVLLFLLTVKCVTVLRVMKTLAASAAVLAHSLSSLSWPLISGLIFAAAFSCLGNLLYAQRFWAFSSIPRSFLTLLQYYQGVRPASGLLLCGSDFLYCGVYHLSSIVIWTAVVVAVLSSSVRSVKQSQRRRDAFTTAELVSYIRKKVSEFTGRYTQPSTDNCEEGKACHLEEFESVVDELLFRLGALSDCLHHSLPPRAHRYRDGDSSALSSDDNQMLVNERTSVCESDQEEALTPSHQFRSRTFQEGQTGYRPSFDTDVASEDKFSASDRLSFTQSASLKSLWTEDVFDKKGNLLIEAKDSCWLSQTGTTQTEVVVEVLIHEEPHGAREV
ncbi:polycystic kidney disease 1 like 1 [Salarias fasciatus]|uniref:polycystic kidney disease 1 like 1 n=1 Tax=Salarias fasciatus TaxID=181472 RepID=UPI001176C330|nr:polycystic kidney disease protein 1-like 1 [Salarias fasciatus]